MKNFADVITEDGWAQGVEIIAQQKSCLGLSFCTYFERDYGDYVERGSVWNDRRTRAWLGGIDRIAAIIQRLWPERVRAGDHPMDQIVAFNDHQQTTFADVKKTARE